MPTPITSERKNVENTSTWSISWNAEPGIQAAYATAAMAAARPTSDR